MEKLFCKFCHSEEALEENNVPMFCTDCGEALYNIDIPPLFYVSNQHIHGRIRIENRSVEEIKLISIRFFENLFIFFSESSIVIASQTKIFELEEQWNYLESIEVHPEIEIEVNGYYKLIKLSTPLWVFPFPKFDCTIHTDHVVSPYTGFKGKLIIELLNNSAIYLKGVTIQEAKPPKEGTDEKEEIVENLWDTFQAGETKEGKKYDHNFEEAMFIKGKNKRHEIEIAFPPFNQYSQKFYRIIPRLFPEDVFNKDELPSCECWVEYKTNPQVSLAVQLWTNKGLAWLSCLESNEFPYLRENSIVTPENYLRFGMSGLKKVFEKLCKKKIEFNIPLGERRIRKILPFLSIQKNNDKENKKIIYDFPCEIKCKNSNIIKSSVYWRKVPLYTKSFSFDSILPFASIENTLYIDSLKEIEYVEILFDLEQKTPNFALEISITFPESNENLEENFEILVYPYEPILFEQPISIDFGTTNSCVVMDIGSPLGSGDWRPEGVVSCLPVDIYQGGNSNIEQSYNPNILPTILAYEPAFNNVSEKFPFIPASTNLPAQICENIKINFLLEFLRKKSIIHPDYHVSTEQQIVDYFKALIEKIKISFEDRQIFTTLLSNLVLTVPTGFPEPVREKYRQIIENLINSQSNLLLPQKIKLSYPQDEALAVLLYALEVYHQQVKDNTIIGVIDFGGGTIDINFIYSINNLRYLLAIGGSNYFGGTTIDRWFLARLLHHPSKDKEKLTPRSDNDWRLYNIDPYLRELSTDELIPDVRVSLSRLKWYLGDDTEFCTQVQNFITRVNSSSSLNITDEWKEKSNIILLLKKTFEIKFEQILKEILLDALGRAIDKKMIKASNNDLKLFLFLAGNASKIYGFKGNVEKIIRKHFLKHFKEIKIFHLENPKEAVALGSRSFVGLAPELDKNTFGPQKSYYIKVSGLVNSNEVIHLNNLNRGLPIIREGEGGNFVHGNIEKIIERKLLLKYDIDLTQNKLQILEKSGIDVNEIHVTIRNNSKEFSKLKFVLSPEGRMSVEGIN